MLFVGIMQVVFNSLVKDQQGGYKYPSLEQMVGLNYADTFFLGANSGRQDTVGYINPDGTKGGKN